MRSSSPARSSRNYQFPDAIVQSYLLLRNYAKANSHTHTRRNENRSNQYDLFVPAQDLSARQ